MQAAVPGFFQRNKILIGLSIAVVVVAGGFAVYWFYFRPKYSQEIAERASREASSNQAPAPVPYTPLPRGTQLVNNPTHKLPRPLPGTATDAHISAASSIRRHQGDGPPPAPLATKAQAMANPGLQSNPQGDEQDLDGFFATSGLPENGEYPGMSI